MVLERFTRRQRVEKEAAPRELSERELLGVLTALDGYIAMLPTARTFDYNQFYAHVATLTAAHFHGVPAATYTEVATLLSVYNAELLRHPRKPLVPSKSGRGWQIARAIALGVGLVGVGSTGATAGYIARGYVEGRPVSRNQDVPSSTVRERPLDSEARSTPSPVAAASTPTAGEVAAYWERYKQEYLPARMSLSIGVRTLNVEVIEGFGWRYEEIPPEIPVFLNSTLMPSKEEKQRFGYPPTLLIAMHTSKYLRYREHQVERDGRLVTVYPPDLAAPIDFTNLARFLLVTDANKWVARQAIPVNPELTRSPLVLVDRKGREHRFSLREPTLIDLVEIEQRVRQAQDDLQILVCAPRGDPACRGCFLNDQRTYWLIAGSRIE